MLLKAKLRHAWPHLSLITALTSRYYYYSHFTDEETEMKESSQGHTALQWLKTQSRVTPSQMHLHCLRQVPPSFFPRNFPYHCQPTGSEALSGK